MEKTIDKIACFKEEMGYIKNQKYREDYQALINGLPDYFFEVAASSTGKYHPSYALGEGGLLRHTKAAVRFAYELLNDPCIGDKYTREEKDLVIIALTLHDGLKHGVPQDKYTKANHPLLAAEYIRGQKGNLSMTEEEIDFLCSVIESHMGPWNQDPYTKEEILPKPKTKYENFVHMCDYLASRKVFLLEFDENNHIIG